MRVNHIWSRKQLDIFVDGSCRANGKDNAVTGIGIVAYYGERKLFYHASLIQDKTNNEAEYRAVIKALQISKTLLPYSPVVIYSDSRLVVNQLKGSWKINEDHLKTLYSIATDIAESFYGVDYMWIPREENGEANDLAQSITEDVSKEK